MPIAARTLPTATVIGCSAISTLCSVSRQPPGAKQRQRQHRQHLGQQPGARPRRPRRLDLDVIVDRADAQATQRQPGGAGPVLRHGLGDQGFRRPVEFHSGLTAAHEIVGIAAAEKIEPDIEGGIAEPLEYRARDQAVAAAVDDRHRAAVVVGGTKCRVAAKSALAVVVEMGLYRPADQVGAGGFRAAHHQLEPVRRGNLVVVDHQEMLGGGKRRHRGLERGIDRVAIALPRLDHAQPGKSARAEKFGGNGHAAAAGGIVFDNDDREAAIGALGGERFQRQPQMLRTAEAGDADHDPDRRVERGRRRRQRAGCGWHHLRGSHRPASCGLKIQVMTPACPSVGQLVHNVSGREPAENIATQASHFDRPRMSGDGATTVPAARGWSPQPTEGVSQLRTLPDSGAVPG